MGITELLDTTPVRGFELDVWEHNGQLVINHSGNFDPLVSEPVTLDSALAEINVWLDKPENKNEVVFICIENHADNEDAWMHLNSMLGDKLEVSCPSQGAYLLDYSINDLSQSGIRVVLVPLAGGSTINEDRTFYAPFLQGLHPDVVPTIDTEKMDELVNSGGGFIKLDQITPNDPRFFTPEDRAELGLKPDISLLQDTIHLGSGDAATALFGVGVGAASGAGIFGLSAGLLQAYSNHQFFKRFPIEIEKTLNNLGLADFRKKIKSDITKDDIENTVKKLLKNEITRKTIQPGLLSTLTISGGIFSLGLLFPVLFPITSITSLGVLGLGSIATTIATWHHRRKINKLANEFFQNNQEQLDRTLNSLNSDTTLQTSQIKVKNITKISDGIWIFGLMTNISSKAKYAIPLVGVVAGGVQTVLGLFKATYNAFINYRDRQLRLNNLANTLKEACDPGIFKKKYLFFGRSKFDNYILANISELPSNITVATDPANQPDYNKITEICQHQETGKQIEKYFKQKKTNLVASSSTDVGIQLKNYINDAVQKLVKKDVRNAGRINTLIVAGSIAALSIVAPPFSGFFLMAALGTMVVGLGITELVARYEQRKFRKQINLMLGGAQNTIQERACQSFYDKLLTSLESKMTTGSAPPLYAIPPGSIGKAEDDISSTIITSSLSETSSLTEPLLPNRASARQKKKNPPR